MRAASFIRVGRRRSVCHGDRRVLSRAAATSRQTASSSGGSPSPAPPRQNKAEAPGPANGARSARAAPGRRARRSCWRRRSPASRPAVRPTRRGPKSSSSRVIISKSSTGSRPLADETSTRWISTFVRSRWLRNRCRDRALHAPSISPERPRRRSCGRPTGSTTPRLGVSVVNG